MSVRVESISKKYGAQWAVKEVSFEVSGGEVAGFIGPNGAGKSTTMKIITGTLQPDEGRVLIHGKTWESQGTAMRRTIGYLPEHNPLYTDMYIREYLRYVAGIYGIKGKKAAHQVEHVIHTTGLTREAGKRIGALSKGYRQRVGLAQALIHDPDILILDEPTTGLDPNQLTEIRGLITEIGKEKTILLSTHILQEVEAICDRVIIINQGRLVANDRAGNLKGQNETSTRTIHIEVEPACEAEIWKGLPFIDAVKTLAANQFLLETSAPRDVRAEISKFAVSKNLTILSLSLKELSLEEVFKQMTRG
ncbi:MAG: ATP-binding cassette domain-containing protein [Bacteroidales bacterium]